MGERRRAFTLLELLIVVVILGIIGASVVPMVSSSQDAQCAAAARALAADIELVQSEALARQAPVALVFSPDNQRYAVVLDQGQDLDAYESLTPLEHPSRPGQDYEVSLASDLNLPELIVNAVDFGGSRYVVFDSVGSPDVGGTVTLVAGDASLTITVEPITGAVSVS